jgi:hypothetical protein
MMVNTEGCFKINFFTWAIIGAVLILPHTLYSQKKKSAKENVVSTKELSQKFLANIIQNGVPSTADIIEFSRNQGASETLLSTYGDLRKLTLSAFVDLGRPLLPAVEQEMIPERLGPIVSNPEIVAYFVSLLRDTDRDIRNRVSTVLEELVPAVMLKPYHDRISSAIRQYPDMDGALLLTGKLLRDEGLSILNSPFMQKYSTSDNYIMASARLGETKAEAALLKAYHDTQDPEEKGALALRLGYASTNATIKLLAAEIRSPEFYYWNQRSRRSLRVDIIEGLHVAFPTEQIFWEPFNRPVNDSYYEAIEQWLTKKLGASWSDDRPPFLYQEDAPIPPRAPR